MSRALFALCLPVVVAAYSCGGSDTSRAASDANAGQSGNGEGGDANAIGASGKGGVTVAPQGGVGGDENGNSPAGGAGGDPAASLGGTAGFAGSTGGDSTTAGAGGEGGNAGAGGQPGAVLPDGLITNVAYTCSSPFEGIDFPSYFYLEDWEDSDLDTPGVTSSSTQVSSSFGDPNLVDSVDCDDGVDDGTCADCDALFANGTVELSFDAQALGSLPTHVGMVWTDGGPGTNVTITGYDALDGVIYSQTVGGIGDGSNYNTTAEDRFFGIVHYNGVKRLVLTNSSGGIEIDHLQYGR